jgi:type VI secretion system protein ImpH
VDTQLLMDRLRDGDDVLRDFLDIFNHRLVSLLYRVRKTHRAGFAYTTPEGDAASRYLLSLAGLGTPGLRRRLGVPDRALPRYAGLLAHYPRSAAGLQALLGAYFAVGVEIRQFQGRWILLEADQQSAIGLSGRNQRLGRDLLLGRWFFDVAGRLEVRLGPLTLGAFRDLLPGGSGFRDLRDLVRLYLGDGAQVDVGLTLAGPEVPVSRLGPAGNSPGPRLGWTTWLKTRPGGTAPAYVALRGRA